MIVQFTRQELEDYCARAAIAAGQKALSVIDAVRHDPLYVSADREKQEHLENGMRAALGSHEAPTWKELLH